MTFTYSLIYFGATDFHDEDDLAAIAGSIVSWTDPPGNVDEDREYIWLRHHNEDDRLFIRLSISNIDDPDTVISDFADFIDLELNGPFGLNLPVPPQGVSVSGISE